MPECVKAHRSIIFTRVVRRCAQTRKRPPLYRTARSPAPTAACGGPWYEIASNSDGATWRARAKTKSTTALFCPEAAGAVASFRDNGIRHPRLPCHPPGWPLPSAVFPNLNPFRVWFGTRFEIPSKATRIGAVSTLFPDVYFRACASLCRLSIRAGPPVMDS